MENNKQEIRQGVNVIKVIGAVKEAKLNKNEKDGKKSIGGSLIVRTGEFSDIEVKVFVGELTKDGKVKKAYTTLESFIDEEYKTMANVKDDEEVAKVRIQGNAPFAPSFRENMYKVKETGEVKTNVQIDLGFGNIVVDNKLTEEDFTAEFDVEIYVKNIREEVDKEDEPTGRALVSGLIPVFGGLVCPVELVAGIVDKDTDDEYDMGTAFLDGVEPGQTIEVWGVMNYQSIVTLVTKGGKFGKAKTEEKRTYIHELIIEGADEVSENKEFDEELIRQAMTQRELKIEEVKNKEDEADTKKGRGGIGNRGKAGEETKTGRTRPRF